MAYTVKEDETISSNSPNDKKVASGKLTRSEYKILTDGLNFRKGASYDKELKRLQIMYPNYFKA